MKFRSLHAALATGIGACVWTSACAASVDIDNCWIRAMPPTVPSSGYFKLKNSGETAIRLTGIVTPSFKRAFLHRTETIAGTSKMVQIDSAEVPARGELVFAPKGYHAMLETPTGPLNIETEIPVTFTWSDGTTSTAQCIVKPASFAGQ